MISLGFSNKKNKVTEYYGFAYNKDTQPL